MGELPMPPGLYNMDCMAAMKQFPDKFFDLAVVDPPYGDAGMEVNSIGGGYGLEGSSTATKPWNRFGQRFDRYKVPEFARGGYGTRSRTSPHRRHLG